MLPLRLEAAQRRFEIGHRYPLVDLSERSGAAHRAYFAAIREAWQSLPDEAADELPTPEALRKFALIKTGWHDERAFSCRSHTEALRLAAFLRPFDPFSVILVRGLLVTVYTARSQSYAAMARDDFNRSRDDVLNYIAGLIGVRRHQLEDAGMQAWHG